MTLNDILRMKGPEIHTTTPQATLAEVVQQLVRYNVGSLIVYEPDGQPEERRLTGIITERDILRSQAEHPDVPLNDLRVENFMSTRLITAGPEDRLEDAMRLMTEKRVRHLPVIEQGKLYGIISIGDVVKTHHDELVKENFYMKSYIRGEGAERATPVEPE